MKKSWLWIGLAFILFIGLMAWSTLGLRKNRVEVCISYHGRSACRVASGGTPEQALRTATDNACAQIASGVTDSIGCQRTKPDSVRWLDR